jgi:membrane-associated protease RseP (regulator of RpoE activity)
LFAAEPPRTNYDLHFNVAGVPVRVHPWFWLMGLLLGVGSFNKPNPPQEIILWVGVVFVSILVHELGHVIAFRYFGQRAKVVLYSFGGLAIPDDRNEYGGYDDYSSSYYRDERTPGAEMTIAFAGPLAGFLLAALIFAMLAASGHKPTIGLGGPTGFKLGFVGFRWENLTMLVEQLLWVNIFWGLINLLPVFPLDGGQISRHFLTKFNPSQGLRQSILTSIVVAAGVAVWALIKIDDKFMAFLFGYLAFVNYQVLQQISGSYGGGRDW